VSHVKDGALRRMIDDPLAASAVEREHLQSCTACAARMTDIRRDQDLASASFASPAPRPDLVSARARLVSGTAGVSTSRRLTWRPLRPSRLPALGWAAGGAIALGLALGFTPAAKVFTIFQPQQFATVPVTNAELRSLPDLRQYGNLHVDRNLNARQFTNGAAAQSAAGFHVVAPGWVPKDVSTQKTFRVVPAETSSFTFSAAKVVKTAARLHHTLRAMPSDINGSTISLVTRPAVMTFYGAANDIPDLVIGQTTMPRVTSSGVSLASIEKYILHLPGVSPQLAQEIESIGKPTTTLPILIPVSWAFAQHVTVQGHPGLLVGDNTGVASVVIWENARVVYGVAGSLTQGQVLQIANSLH
jgi:hypothetical protein